MKQLLFPRVFRSVGWVLFSAAVIMGILYFTNAIPFSSPFGIVETIVIDAIIIGIVVGSLFIVCSKTKQEDEMTQAIRLNSLLSSLYVYALIIIVGTLACNLVKFLLFASISLVFLPIIYMIIFNLTMYRYKKLSDDEEQD